MIYRSSFSSSSSSFPSSSFLISFLVDCDLMQPGHCSFLFAPPDGHLQDYPLIAASPFPSPPSKRPCGSALMDSEGLSASLCSFCRFEEKMMSASHFRQAHHFPSPPLHLLAFSVPSCSLQSCIIHRTGGHLRNASPSLMVPVPSVMKCVLDTWRPWKRPVCPPPPHPPLVSCICRGRKWGMEFGFFRFVIWAR